MPVVVVANPKGGVGKSTLATNLAGWYATQGKAVMLGDVDRQQTAREWLKLRPESARRIGSWEVDAKAIARPPKGTTHVVLDTPAGIHGAKLEQALKYATHVIVPLQPSLFDILATQPFLDDIRERVADTGLAIGVVGMRVDSRTRAADQLQRFCETLGLPVLGMLRDTQVYVQLAAHGLTLWDVAPSKVEKDSPQWRSMIEWLGR